jgi:hypothetical protein
MPAIPSSLYCDAPPVREAREPQIQRHDNSAIAPETEQGAGQKSCAGEFLTTVGDKFTVYDRTMGKPNFYYWLAGNDLWSAIDSACAMRMRYAPLPTRS